MAYVLILPFCHFDLFIHFFDFIFEVILLIYRLIVIRILSSVDKLLYLSLQFLIFGLYLSVLLFHFSVVINLCEKVGVVELELTILTIKIGFFLLIDKSLASLCLLINAAFFIMMIHLFVTIFDLLDFLIQFFDALIQSLHFTILFGQFFFQSLDLALLFCECQFKKFELLFAEEDVIF